jgi:pantoate--beta-alanine ligase
MITLSSAHQLQTHILALKKAGKTIGFIPTMGALHKGHLSLVQAAKAQCDIVVVSIFVNPTQFAPHEDLEKYPRPFEQDHEKLLDAGVSILFAPTEKEIYPTGKTTTTHIELPHLSTPLCGKSRPHFFKGVLMVVNRLLNIVQPTKAFFGEKDFQQLTVITQMVADLFMPVQIIGCPTKREPDGLAMSSRNTYLSQSERKKAIALYEAMTTAKTQFTQGQTSAKALIAQMTGILKAADFKVDYVKIIDPKTLKSVTTAHPNNRIVIAAYIGTTRLIDNMVL